MIPGPRGGTGPRPPVPSSHPILSGPQYFGHFAATGRSVGCAAGDSSLAVRR